jgi:hypothetical protein
VYVGGSVVDVGVGRIGGGDGGKGVDVSGRMYGVVIAVDVFGGISAGVQEASKNRMR